jgi:hypothetical protein
MYPVHCPLKDFDLDRFLNVNLMFAAKMSGNEVATTIATVGYNANGDDHFEYPVEWDNSESIHALKDVLDRGQVLFLPFHERFSESGTILCVDGEMHVEGVMEDRNYGFELWLQDGVQIESSLLIDPDHKKTTEAVLEGVEHCGQFDARMNYFLKSFRTDQMVKDHTMAGI